MATYKILYWQEIPSQIKVEEGGDEVTLPLAPKFMERIDAMAEKRGLTNSDDYLEQFRWSEEVERDGSAQEVAEAIKAEMEAKADW